MRTYKPRNREKLIEQANMNSLTHLLKAKGMTVEQKQELIKERNPYLHIFGDRLEYFNEGYQSYEEFINHLYLGEASAQQGEAK
jgi:predicted N-acyltransferase